MEYQEIITVAQHLKKLENTIGRTLDDNNKIILKTVKCAFFPDEVATHWGYAMSEDNRELHHPLGTTKMKELDKTKKIKKGKKK
jgi:hypothetical protein